VNKFGTHTNNKTKPRSNESNGSLKIRGRTAKLSKLMNSFLKVNPFLLYQFVLRWEIVQSTFPYQCTNTSV